MGVEHDAAASCAESAQIVSAGQQCSQFATLVERDEIVTATNVGLANENLRHGAPAGELHHGISSRGVQIDADFIDDINASGLEQRLGAHAVGADLRGVHPHEGLF